MTNSNEKIEMIISEFVTHSSPIWVMKLKEVIALKDSEITKAVVDNKALTERYLNMEEQRGVFCKQVRERDKVIAELKGEVMKIKEDVALLKKRKK